MRYQSFSIKHGHEIGSETADTSLFSNQMISYVNIEKILKILPNIWEIHA